MEGSLYSLRSSELHTTDTEDRAMAREAHTCVNVSTMSTKALGIGSTHWCQTGMVWSRIHDASRNRKRNGVVDGRPQLRRVHGKFLRIV